jgi:hypothetical protein
MCAWNPQTAYEDLMSAGEHLADARKNRDTLADTKAIAKIDGIKSLLGTENPLTGKMHSASSAETMVESVHSYAEHLRALRLAEYDLIIARAKYDGIKAAHHVGATQEAA